MRRYPAASLAALTLAVVLLTACSSGGGSGDPAAASGAASAAGGKAASGTPIKFGVLSPVTGEGIAVPSFEEGVKAAAAYINDQLGGVKGHPLQMVYCDSQGMNPSVMATCVHGFVADNVIGILNFGVGNTILPIAAAAGISEISPGATLAEEQSKYTIILQDDPTSGYAALFSYAKKQGKTSVGSMVTDIPQNVALYREDFARAARKAGVKFVRSVPVAATAADFTPDLLRAAQGVDIVTMAFGPPQMAQIVRDAEAADVHVQFAASSTAIDEKNFVQPAGSAAEGFLAYSGVLLYNSPAPQAVTYRGLMQRAGFGAGIGGVSELGFSYLMTAYTALTHMTQYTASALRDYFNTHKVPVYLGATYDASKTPFPDQPAVHVTATRIAQVKNGQFVDVGGGWIDSYGS